LEKKAMSKLILIGWVMELAGIALWLYGYFVAGHPPLVNWHDKTPWWIAGWLPNLESEVGMALVFAGMVPIYWPRER
jgi:Ni,Fe-hydrogenase I cytochrome b subunit